MANESPSLFIETKESHIPDVVDTVESRAEYSPSAEMRQLRKLLDKADADMELVKLKLSQAAQLSPENEIIDIGDDKSASKDLKEILKRKEKDPLECIRLLNLLKASVHKAKDRVSTEYYTLTNERNRLQERDIADAHWDVERHQKSGWLERATSFIQAGKDRKKLDKLFELSEKKRQEISDKEYERNRLSSTLNNIDESLMSVRHVVYKESLPNLVNEYREYATKVQESYFKEGDLFKELEGKSTEPLPQAAVIKVLGALVAGKFKKFVDEIYPEDGKPNYDRSQIESEIRELISKTYDEIASGARDMFTSQREVFQNAHEFQQIKNSPGLRYLARIGVEFLDETLHAMAKSYMLSDSEGRSILCAQYYPDPEIIRNLAYLACAGPHGYRYQSVDTVLQTLSKQEDWPQLLDEAEKIYPELKNIRDDLIKWGPPVSWNERDKRLKAGLKESALKVVEGKERYRTWSTDIENVAHQILPNLTLFEILSERKLMESGVGARVEEALQILKKHGKASLENLPRGSEIYPPVENFSTQLRKATLEYLRSPHLKEGLALDSLVKITDEVTRLYGEDIPGAETDPTKAKESDYKVNYVISAEITSLASGSPEELPNILTAYERCPALLEDPGLRKVFVDQLPYYKEPEKLESMQKFADLLGVGNPNLYRACELIAKNSLSIEFALSLDQRLVSALESPVSGVLLAFTDVFLKDEESFALFEKSSVLYLDSRGEFHNIVYAMQNGDIKREHLCEIPKHMKLLLMTGEESRTNEMMYVLSNGKTLIRDVSDLQFINTFFGTYGGRAFGLLKGYHECLKAGVITLAEKQVVFEFLQDIKALSPGILKGYIEAKESGIVETYSTLLRQTSEKMISQESCTKEEMEKPYYIDLLRHVYAENSGNWGSIEGNKKCEDRSQDLKKYKFKPRYSLDLFAANEVKVKKGMEIDQEKMATVQAPIYNIEKKFNAMGYNNEKVLEDVDSILEKQFAEIEMRRGWKGKEFTREEKMFAVILQSVYGGQNVEGTKELLLQYEFASFENVRDYIAGTNDRVAAAPNKEYALLCELNTFYADRVKEVNRLIAQKSHENPLIQELIKDHFTELAKRKAAENKSVGLNKLQVDKLGLAEGFVKQMAKTLKKRTGKTYTDKQVRRIISWYEKITTGLSTETTSTDKGTQAFFGQLRAQRNKSIVALEKITGEVFDPKTLQLEDIDFQSVLSADASVNEGVYNEEAFMAYTVDRMIKLFESE
ncbi:MAG: hypothetical protein V4664_00945, partial [Patescibacteria group bacterium]